MSGRSAAGACPPSAHISAHRFPRARSEFALALALALVSGAAGLAHQILWTRRLIDLLGASADTFSKVIGAFFLGLALGAWCASRPNKSRVNFWRRVALAELAVGVLAVPVLLSAGFAESARLTLGSGVQFFLPLLLVTPPAAAMGLVIPWMVRALSTHPLWNAALPVWLYVLNTLGGVLGTVLVLWKALPVLGLSGAGWGAITLNVLVAGGAVVLQRWSKADSMLVPPEPASSLPLGWFTKGLAFASGFLVLSLEVLLQHQLSQVTINSLFSSAMVLTMVLLSLTAAAALVPALVRWLGKSRSHLTSALLAAGALCAVQPFLLTGLRDGVTILPYELPPMAYSWEVAKLGLLAVCPMLLGGGLVFPLLLSSAAAAGQGAGSRQIGLLLAWNGLGGWLGAETCQSWIAPAFGLWRSVVLLGGVYLALAIPACLHERNPSRPSSRSWLGAILFLAGGISASVWLSGRLPQATVNPGERLADLQVGRDGVVATLECGPGDWRMLFNNSYTLGGSKAQFNQERQAHVPLLLHGQARTVAVLGVATGSTVAGAALHPEVEKIDAVELSPLVLKFAEEYFGPFNRHVFRDPRVHFIQEDARWIIARQVQAYDVVIGDLFLPWRTGEGRLFTLEHFQSVRRSLTAGGLYCQWLPLFQLTRPQFDSIARTFREVFPDAYLVRGDFYTELPIVGLVGGSKLARVDWPAMEGACTQMRAARSVSDPLVRHAEGIASLLIGPLPDRDDGPVNTLANAWLEWDAGRNILGMRTPWFIGVPCAEYVRDIHRVGQTLLPPEFRAAHEAGQFFLTLEIAAKLNLPVLAEMKAQLPARMPRCMLEDQAADWRQWPMRVKPEFKREMP